MKKLSFLPFLLFVGIQSIAQCTNIDTTGNLIAYWKLDGNALDASGNGHNGVVTGATPTTDSCGNPSGAYLFTRSIITAIDVPTSADLSLSNTDFTISFWVYEPDSTVHGGNVILKRNGTGPNNGYFIGTGSPDHRVNYTMAGGTSPSFSFLSNTAIDSLVWTHIVTTYSYSNHKLRMYINGVLDKDSTNVPSPTATSASLAIGRDLINTNAPRFNGKIDNIRIYGRTLDSCEIAALYKSPCSKAFPVHLLTFTAHLKDNNALLHWQVANEQNFDRYQIERRIGNPNTTVGAGDFTSIGTVKAANKKEYDFTDKDPTRNQPTKNEKQETLYYRLKMIDRDGTFTYSPIRQLTINHSQLTPTPPTTSSQYPAQTSKPSPCPTMPGEPC